MVQRKVNSGFNRVYAVAVAIVMALGLAVLAVLQFANGRYQAEMQDWQVRLSLIADSRQGAVEEWLEQQFNEIRDLADNYAVKRVLAREAGVANDLPTQEMFLRHLLTITASRGGFVPAEGAAQGEGGGIALLDMQGEVRMATPDMPPLVGALAGFVADAVPAQPHLLDMSGSADGSVLRMGFLLPVYSAQGEMSPASQIGWVFGLRGVGDDLFGRLRHPGVTESTLETLLVREENEAITFLSPLADGTRPLRKQVAIGHDGAEAAEMAELFAIRAPGQFALRRDYRHNTVLMTSRVVGGSGWTLVTKVDEDEALAAAKAARRALLTQLLLVVAAVFTALIAAWRHGTSRRTERMASTLEKALHQAETRRKMLEVVTNTQPGAIFIVDEQGKCWFANEAFAQELGVERQDVAGKTLEALLGAALAKEYMQVCHEALQENRTMVWTLRGQDESGQEAVLRLRHIPLEQLPAEEAPEGARGVLVLGQDITAVVLERERRVRTLRSIIDTLVTMVDRRDPYAANHSLMVATVSREVALGMECDEQTVETAEIAGMLMNIGKMVVPPEWLTKPGALNAKERKAIRDSLLESANMLEGVEFDGPVTETLRQSLEKWDGSGMQGLKGEEILLTARIVAAANAFVGMVSPRAYRKAMGMTEALNLLMKGIDSEFDRKVVVALANYIDNRGGRAIITNLAKTSES